ncbi:hypothetical protein C2845_PM05G12010 [Panicum miliaceum]|uniref:Uncharacterized protein n=1 Tax=Panicum miliaceum TaxID=4540 RepID=A0A3L6T0N0_PANMI|nr:hypothetical protein C2845_PM05G12010 [Panicum miliaceum]
MASSQMSIVLSSLQVISGDDCSGSLLSGVFPVRYVYHLSKESGWWCSADRLGVSIPFWVVTSSDGLEVLAMLEASDSITIGDAVPVRSTFQMHIEFDMLFVVPFTNYKASLQASSSRRVSASSCKLGEFLCYFVRRRFVEWPTRSPMTKTTGRFLQEVVCNFIFLKGAFVRGLTM